MNFSIKKICDLRFYLNYRLSLCKNLKRILFQNLNFFINCKNFTQTSLKNLRSVKEFTLKNSINSQSNKEY
ncbi:hypothetical protein [Campylobacter cuniculorum]|uniref:hypothetical protein n=1 Tax=Campylobacter cuniculorum TaxID=374106 RepID=UPI0023EFE639|nr:hypothetical protein [Campylobacter cuniculorum]